MANTLNNCPAPAKLNLFLHVTGRRPDGYHLLQTVFQLLDRGDLLHFKVRDDGEIRRATDVPGVPEDADLVVRAARLLQSAAPGARKLGAEIAVEKRLPMGGGLGGGSSDAATTLIALNHLWQTGLSREELMTLGLRLGADVPFFIFGRNAFAEGVGEDLAAVDTPDCWYVVIEPGVSAPTAAIFSAPDLTRSTKPVKISDFSSASNCFGKNDLQVVATRLFPPIAEAIEWLQQFGDARMTGSGACVFCAFAQEHEADEVLKAAQESGQSQWKVWKARAIERHPLSHLLDS
ncbi:MAG TPA: 4-(cytidine 5'-diphospho)-2-C-methyl-D-erythritol kinase [Verrucomicrobiae bacterium]|uniref:4-(cytidine 5'-diphospho)-2-C-methyl-D-erythritol kinase n=1 Tax=Noviherbaspirillum sp. TaxID=1926288 RepID=UPI002D521F86|nr:4-(cytidine 5'-diphospho)-2-C-methyl-D-erythritol kinase [Noviherbaspirillum sp.]HYG21352.1 4-(cytidine 5'-diphospho)-2-C-methyl-D-erythritol kinase [Verrucomicrobiae bacterium]HZW20943.1 4-(cytidine 5'-diphospho)-2-C-methyl-D-erythritol kinase [Noviherbaspirillum sp.]